MYRLCAALIAACLAAGLVACSDTEPTPAPDDATGDLSRDMYYLSPGEHCPATVWVTGVIVKAPLARDPAWPSGDPVVGTGIQDDTNGVVYGLKWGYNNTALIEYGRRYKLGGAWFGNAGVTFWACAGAEAVIPQ